MATINKATIDCPHCKREITVKPQLTLKQARAVKALTSGEHTTQTEAAKAAGIHYTTLSALLKDGNFALTLASETRKQADKARDALPRLLRLKHRALDKLEDVELDAAGAAAVLKIATDAQAQEVRLKEMIGEPTDSEGNRTSWTSSVNYAVRLGIRAYQRFGPRVLAGIPEKVERRMMRNR